MKARCASLLLILSSSGCASTSGREWLEAPIEPRASALPSEHPITAPDAAVAAVDSRPRLQHTVTLGETYEIEQTAPAAAGPAVQVNVTAHIPVVVASPVGYGYGYAYGYAPSYGYGAARGYARVSAAGAPVRSTPSAPQKVDGDFPAPPDYGPRALR